jgi:hypothetical protein
MGGRVAVFVMLKPFVLDVPIFWLPYVRSRSPGLPRAGERSEDLAGTVVEAARDVQRRGSRHGRSAGSSPRRAQPPGAIV